MSEKLICEHISVSRSQVWSECKAKYKYRYHDKIVPNVPEQPYFAYGKLVHKIAEVYVKEQGKISIESIAADCLSGKIEIEKNKPNPEIDPNYKKKLHSHIESIKQLSDRIGYDGHIEFPFSFDLDPPNNDLAVGFIDRLIIRGDKYFIIDYKTTKKGKWRKNKKTISSDLQMRLYGRVVQKMFNAKAENIRAALFYLDGNELVATRFNERSLETAENELRETYKDIIATNANNVFGRVGDHCTRCDYRKVCVWYTYI